MIFRRPSVRYGRTPEPETPYQKAAQVWDERIGSARVQAKNWRLMAFGSLILSAGLAVSLVWQSTRGTVTPWVVQVDKPRPGAGGRARDSRLSADRSRRSPITSRASSRMSAVCRPIRSCCAQNGCSAYDFTTDRGAHGAQRLRPHQRSLRQARQAADRRRRLQRHPRLAGFSFRVAWIQRRYENGALADDRALDRDPHHRDPDPARRRPCCARIRSASTSTPSTGRRSSDNDRRFPWNHGPASRSSLAIRLSVIRLGALLMSASALAGCAHFMPPEINYDERGAGHAASPIRRRRSRSWSCRSRCRCPGS